MFGFVIDSGPFGLETYITHKIGFRICKLLFRPHVLLTSAPKTQKYPWFWTQGGLELTFRKTYID
jgi:hypothetical protein